MTPAQMLARETPAFAPKAPGPKPALFSPVSTAKKKTCVYEHHEKITVEYDDTTGTACARSARIVRTPLRRARGNSDANEASQDSPRCHPGV